MARQRRAILVALLALSALSWVVVLWQAGVLGGGTSDAIGSGGAASTAAGSMGPTMPDALTMGMAAPLFLATWIVMMAAMMLPSAAPMILMFDAVQGGRSRQGRPSVPTWVFVGAYLAVWAGFGVIAYAAALGAEWLSGSWPWFATAAPVVGGVVIVAGGVYQLTPLKQACLSKCRTPTQFVLTSWRSGYRGAFRMGIEHGIFCLGCCWLLFVILFPLGIMNVAAMAAVALLVLAEKTLPIGRRLSWALGGVLIAVGSAVIALPALLPTTM
jgi:predicted metal-binding membrane protein